MRINQTWGDHLQDLTTRSSREFKNAMGGKAGLLEFLRQDTKLAEHILPGFYISPEVLQSGNIPDLPSDFQGKKLIFRSTNPADAFDFIGVLPTKEFIPPKPRFEDPMISVLRMDCDQARYSLVQEFEDCMPARRLKILSFAQRISKTPSGLIPRQAGIMGLEVNEIDFLNSWIGKIREGEDVTNTIQELTEQEEREKEKELNNQIPKHHETVQRISSILDNLWWGENGIHHNITHPRNNTGIYVQEILRGDFVGSVVEHPHQPGVYMIFYRRADRKLHDAISWSSFLDEKGKKVLEHTSFGDVTMGGTTQKWEKDLVDLYKKVKSKNIFEEGISLQMEFGTGHTAKPYIFQVRQFRPFQKAKWQIEKGTSTTAFGITPEEGIEINYQNFQSPYEVIASSVLNGVNGIIVDNLQRETSPEFPLQNFTFFAPGRNVIRPTLEHHTYGPAMVIEYTLLNSSLLLRIPNNDPTGRMLYRSDGVSSSIEQI